MKQTNASHYNRNNQIPHDAYLIIDRFQQAMQAAGILYWIKARSIWNLSKQIKLSPGCTRWKLADLIALEIDKGAA